MSNRPLFDDEDLPAWLKNAGITYGSGEGQAAPESSTPSASPGSDDLSWLDESVQSTPGGALPFDANVPWDSSDSSMTDTISAAPDWMKDLQASPASPEPAPWMQSAVPEEDTSSTSASNREESLPWEDNSTDESTTAPAGFGTTGALPWRQDVSDPADQPSATSSELSWLDEAPATESAPAEPSSSSETLAWQQEPADDVQLPSGSTDAASWVSAGPPTLPKPPTSEPPAITDDDLSWLSEAAPAEPAAELPISQVPVEPTAPTPEPPAITDDDLSWLSEAAPAEPAAPPAEAPRPAIRKLPTANQPPVESAGLRKHHVQQSESCQPQINHLLNQRLRLRKMRHVRQSENCQPQINRLLNRRNPRQIFPT